MANPHTNHLAAMLLVLLFLTASSARPLNDNYNYFSLAATEPTLNLALPTDKVVMPVEEKPAGHVSACSHMRVTGKLPLRGTRLAGGKYGPMILNMLPKGPVPPSGPSKGTNNLNN